MSKAKGKPKGKGGAKAKAKAKGKGNRCDDDGVPMECSPDEFSDLLAEASALSPEEARSELLDCARYGEVDAVRAILDAHEPRPSSPGGVGGGDEKKDGAAAYGGGADGAGGGGSSVPPFVDCRDAGGSTPLHRACANGHAPTVRLLLARGASYFSNDSGNTPLHWASANGHEEVVDLLLREPRFNGKIDVLAKNDFGRSSLTEGFTSKKTELVRLLLEHESAEEERLLSGGKEVKMEEGGADGKRSEEGATTTAEDDVAVCDSSSMDTSGTGSSAACVVHEFDFTAESGPVDASEADDGRAGPRTVRVRELPIAHADDPFGDRPEEDTTGLGIWCASLVMARWVSSRDICRRVLDGKRVLELGSGCGVPGLAAAVHSKAASVCVADLNPATLRNLAHNIELNAEAIGMSAGGDPRATAVAIDWGDRSTWPEEKADVVLGSDLIYQASIVPLLRGAISGLLKPHGTFLYVCPDTGRDGFPEFIKAMRGEGFECVSERVAPDTYRDNPLKSGDEEECFLHFHELASTAYVLYEFRRC